MSAKDLVEHQRYLGDTRRTAAYRAALLEVVQPGDVVLDLGAGTGLLGYLACEAGASRVIAVERGDIVGLTRRVAADNGHADRITHIQSSSMELSLERRADVVVCDQIGGLVHDAGILRYFADARRRLLAPGAQLVPAGFRLFLAPVAYSYGRDAIEFWSSRPSGIDVSAARSVAANTEWQVNVSADEVSALSGGREIASFTSDHEAPIRGTASFTIGTPGRLDGFMGWFQAQLSPSVTLTNDPWSPDRFDRWCNFYPLDRASVVGTGDTVRVDLDLRPALQIASWSAVVECADGAVHRGRQSTFGSGFISVTKVKSLTGTMPVASPFRAAALQQVIELMDGTRTHADIVTIMSDQVGNGFSARASLEAFVSKVVALSRPGG